MSSSYAPGPAPVPKQNWFKRNWKWFVPVGCAGIIAVFIGFIAVLFLILMGSIKTSDAFKMALDAAQKDARVQEKLGTPIEAGWFVSGNINVSGATGEANLVIPIHGPRGKGKLYAEGTKSTGQWNFSNLIVEVESDGTRIDLLDSGGRPESP